MLHLHPRPIPFPDGVVALGPAAHQTLDGSREAADLIVRTRTESVRIFSTAPGVVVETLERSIDASTREIWLIDRRRLTMVLGGPPTALERALQQLTRKRALGFRGFTGIATCEPRGLDVYDEVRNDVSLSTRPPSTRA